MPNNPLATSSTDQVKVSQFSAHGVVDIWMDGRVLHYEASGPFNPELMDCLAIAQRDFLLATRPQGAWASICTVLGSAMSSPEGIARYAALMATPKPDNMNPVATAFVVAPEVEGSRLMAPIFSKIYADIGRPFQIFETMAAALAWTETMVGQASTDKSAPT